MAGDGLPIGTVIADLERRGCTSTLGQDVMKLYCSCGYPIWVRARWTGREIVLVLCDGQQEGDRAAEPLSTCLHCHALLTPADLTWLPPPTPPWPPFRPH